MAGRKLEPTRNIDRLTDELCDALLTPDSRDQVRLLLRDLCTPAELKALAERWHVARLLDGTKLSYREISEIGRASCRERVLLGV